MTSPAQAKWLHHEFGAVYYILTNWLDGDDQTSHVVRLTMREPVLPKKDHRWTYMVEVWTATGWADLVTTKSHHDYGALLVAARLIGFDGLADIDHNWTPVQYKCPACGEVARADFEALTVHSEGDEEFTPQEVADSFCNCLKCEGMECPGEHPRV